MKILDRKNIYKIISIISFLILSEIIIWLFFRNNIFIPPPSHVFLDIFKNLDTHFENFISTFKIIILGIFPAIIIGWLLAILCNENKKIDYFLRPLIDSTQLIPKTALIPIFLVFSFLGYSLKSKILITFLISFYPVFIDTLLGLNHINEGYLLYFKSINANRWQTLRFLKIPYSTKYTINGIRTSILYSVIGAVTSEILIGMEGIGYSIAYSAEKLNFLMAYSGILMCIILGLLLLSIFQFLLLSIKFIKDKKKCYDRKKILERFV